MASVKARIRCEIEVDVGTWNSSASFEQLKEQVRSEGRHLVEGVLQGGSKITCPRGKIVGEPKVLFVVAMETKGGE